MQVLVSVQRTSHSSHFHKVHPSPLSWAGIRGAAHRGVPWHASHVLVPPQHLLTHRSRACYRTATICALISPLKSSAALDLRGLPASTSVRRLQHPPLQHQAAGLVCRATSRCLTRQPLTAQPTASPVRLVCGRGRSCQFLFHPANKTPKKRFQRPGAELPEAGCCRLACLLTVF